MATEGGPAFWDMAGAIWLCPHVVKEAGQLLEHFKIRVLIPLMGISPQITGAYISVTDSA